MEDNTTQSVNDQRYRELLFFKACAAVFALTDEEKLRLWHRVLEARPALRGQ